MPCDVKAPRFGEPGLSLGSHQPHLDDLRGERAPVVRVEKARPPKVSYRLQGVEQARCQGNRLGLAALDRIDVLHALLDKHVAPDDHAGRFEVDVGQLQGDDFAAPQAPVAREKDSGMRGSTFCAADTMRS